MKTAIVAVMVVHAAGIADCAMAQSGGPGIPGGVLGPGPDPAPGQ